MLDAHGFDVVAQAGDAPDLVREVGAHRPDAAVIDIRMSPTNTDDGLRNVPLRPARPRDGAGRARGRVCEAAVVGTPNAPESS
jgi:hypothetical protein